jgi:TRAP-type mannitol/chloroaromatic compound transport system permease small subunit
VLLVNGLETLVRAIDGFNDAIGRTVMWLTLGTVLVCFAVVTLRYAFSIGYTWMGEIYVWQHAVVFLVGAGYTMRHGGHVRVDVFYGKFSPRRKAMVDIFGTMVFLFPWLFVVAYLSRDFVLGSWAIREPSFQANGLQGLFLLKTCIWVFCGVVALQGIAMIARSLLVIGGREHWLAESSH